MYFRCSFYHIISDHKITDDKCPNIIECIMKSHKLWYNSYSKFKNDVLITETKKTYDIQWALKHVFEFAEAIQKYMDNFSKENRCDTTSKKYKNKYTHIIRYIQALHRKKVEKHKYDHDIFCCDYDNYDIYELCAYHTNKRIKSWIKCFCKYLDYKCDKYIDHTIDDEESELPYDPKEERRNDFKKNTKGKLRDKARYYKKKYSK